MMYSAYKLNKQGCILSPCLFNLYAEYIMLNARLDEAQAGIKTARRNINNLRYADISFPSPLPQAVVREATSGSAVKFPGRFSFLI